MRKQSISKCRYCGTQNVSGICGKCYEKLKLMKGWHWEYKSEKKFRVEVEENA